MTCECGRLTPIDLIPGDGLPLLFELSDDADPEAAVFDEGDRIFLVLTAYDKTWEIVGIIDGNSARVLIPGDITCQIGETRVQDVHLCLHIQPPEGERRTVKFGEDKEHGIEGQYWYPLRVRCCHPE